MECSSVATVYTGSGDKVSENWEELSVASEEDPSVYDEYAVEVGVTFRKEGTGTTGASGTYPSENGNDTF